MKPLRFYDYMRAAHVKRWHIVHTTHNQNVAEHSFLVTIIALELFNRIVGTGDDRESAMKLVLMCLFHDMGEVRTGDVPTPAKREIRAVLESMQSLPQNDLFDEIDSRLMPKVPYLWDVWPDGDANRTNSLLYDILGAADKIADAWWITENALGIHGDMVKRANVRSMMEFVITLDDRDQSRSCNWIENVNAILQELGMPYISQSLRETPP